MLVVLAEGTHTSLEYDEEIEAGYDERLSLPTGPKESYPFLNTSGPSCG